MADDLRNEGLKNRFKGRVKEGEGQLREKIGDLRDDPREELKGNLELREFETSFERCEIGTGRRRIQIDADAASDSSRHPGNCRRIEFPDRRLNRGGTASARNLHRQRGECFERDRSGCFDRRAAPLARQAFDFGGPARQMSAQLKVRDTGAELRR